MHFSLFAIALDTEPLSSQLGKDDSADLCTILMVADDADEIDEIIDPVVKGQMVDGGGGVSTAASTFSLPL